MLVCTKAPRAGLDTEAEQSLLLLMVPFFLASSNLLEQPGLWSGGAGRQREAAWEHQDAKLASITRYSHKAVRSRTGLPPGHLLLL